MPQSHNSLNVTVQSRLGFRAALIQDRVLPLKVELSEDSETRVDDEIRELKCAADSSMSLRTTPSGGHILRDLKSRFGDERNHLVFV
jgi:hypothetical protein